MSHTPSRALIGSERALFWALAIAVFAATLGGLGARAVDRLSGIYETERRAYVIVRVLAPEGPEATPLAQAVLADRPEVARAAPMSQARAADLLARSGGGVAAEDLPPLRLIEVELAPDASAEAGDALEAALAAAGITAEAVRAPEGTNTGALAVRARQVALWAAVAFAGAMALIISLAARGFVARQRDLVAVLADLGATRGKAAGRVADQAAASGFWAGLTGAALAGAAGAGLMLAFIPGATLSGLPSLLLPIDVAPLAAAPLFAAIAAGMGARRAAESHYDHAARLA